MGTFLNIALVLVAATATLAAFGGETWTKGPEPLRDRITRRGWISLGCLVATLSLGVAKEIEAYSAQKKSQNLSDSLSEDLHKSQVALNQASREISGLQDQLTSTQGQVTSAEKSILVLQNALADAHADLSTQSSVNLLSLLANTTQTVSAIEIAIPFTARKATASKAYDVLVPSGRGCRPGDVESSIWRGSPSDADGITYRETDRQRKLAIDRDHVISLGTWSISDYLSSYPLPWEKKHRGVAALLGQESYNFQTLYVDLRPKTSIYASDIIGPLSADDSLRPLIFTIVTDNPTSGCKEQLKSTLAAAFDKAYYGIVLAGDEHMRIYFKLRALAPVVRGVEIEQAFASASKPAVIVDKNLEHLMDLR